MRVKAYDNIGHAFDNIGHMRIIRSHTVDKISHTRVASSHTHDAIGHVARRDWSSIEGLVEGLVGRGLVAVRCTVQSVGARSAGAVGAAGTVIGDRYARTRTRGSARRTVAWHEPTCVRERVRERTTERGAEGQTRPHVTATHRVHATHSDGGRAQMWAQMWGTRTTDTRTAGQQGMQTGHDGIGVRING